jgi:hypothetical protein
MRRSLGRRLERNRNSSRRLCQKRGCQDHRDEQLRQYTPRFPMVVVNSGIVQLEIIVDCSIGCGRETQVIAGLSAIADRDEVSRAWTIRCCVSGGGAPHKNAGWGPALRLVGSDIWRACRTGWGCGGLRCSFVPLAFLTALARADCAAALFTIGSRSTTKTEFGLLRRAAGECVAFAEFCGRKMLG